MAAKMTKRTKLIVAIVAIAVCAITLLLLLFLPKSTNTHDNPALRPPVSTEAQDMTVSVIDVGQGSATLIMSEGQVLLVDAGEASSSRTVVAYLEAEGVQEIDYLVATHPDADHIGGMPAVLDAFQVDDIIYPIPENDTATYRRFVEKAEAEPGATFEHPTTGDHYLLGDAVVTVIYDGNDSVYSPASKSYDTNRASIVLRIDCGGKSMLLMGDYPGKMESDLIANQATSRDLLLTSDVLQVAHHGSKNSTTDDFLLAVNPTIAVISVGENNRYGHPHDEVLNRLLLLSITTYRTDTAGTATLLFIDGVISITTEDYLNE
jgi:competence protein ComEC